MIKRDLIKVFKKTNKFKNVKRQNVLQLAHGGWNNKS